MPNDKIARVEPILNLCAYRFVALADAAEWRDRIRTQAAALGLRGTILLAPEGLNLFVAGPDGPVHRFMHWLTAQAPFTGLEAKTSRSRQVPFARLRVKLKPENASNTRYRLTRQVAASMVPSARDVSVTVSWANRSGDLQQVKLESVIAANDPALSGALGVAPAAATANGPMGRAIGIPLTARALGAGLSAFGLPGGGTTTFLADNASGLVEQRCVALAGAASVRTLADVSACVPVTAYLLTGVVRFATGSSVETIGPVMSAGVALLTSGGVYPAAPECSSTAVATADGDHYLQYACIVYPLANGRWSGESQLVPDRWTFGGAGYQVCAEGPAAGLGRLGNVAANPTINTGLMARYSDVPGTLANQNFRIVRRNLACPA